MKPNNLYYREIAISIVGEVFPKFYSSLYYMRKIAEELMGSQYTGRKPSNKYLKDWHTALTGETPSVHKYNIYYLRNIAKYYDPSIDEDTLNENQCLRIISENVSPVPPTPTPTPTSIDLTATQSILSYADSDTTTLTATVLDENDDPCSNVSVELYKDEVLWDTLTTNASGEVTKTYSATGSGDIEVVAKCNLLTDSLTIEDCTKYDSNTYSSYNVSLNYNLPSHFKIEYESYITQTTNNSCFIRVGESDSRALLTGKVGSGDSVWKVTVRTSSSGTGDIPTTGGTISLSNDWQPNTITFDGTSYKFHDITVTNLNGVSLSKLVSFATWKQSTTSGQIRNIKIKPL